MFVQNVPDKTLTDKIQINKKYNINKKSDGDYYFY